MISLVYADQMTIEFSHRLQTLFRSSDVVSRFGGDEFFIFMKEIQDENHIRKKAQKRFLYFLSRYQEIRKPLRIVIDSGFLSVYMKKTGSHLFQSFLLDCFFCF